MFSAWRTIPKSRSARESTALLSRLAAPNSCRPTNAASRAFLNVYPRFACVPHLGNARRWRHGAIDRTRMAARRVLRRRRIRDSRSSVADRLYRNERSELSNGQTQPLYSNCASSTSHAGVVAKIPAAPHAPHIGPGACRSRRRRYASGRGKAARPIRNRCLTYQSKGERSRQAAHWRPSAPDARPGGCGAYRGRCRQFRTTLADMEL